MAKVKEQSNPRLRGWAEEVRIFQAFGLGKREVKDCYVVLEGGRCELRLREPDPHLGTSSTIINLPMDVCTIFWKEDPDAQPSR